jgi:hypothetical protein
MHENYFIVSFQATINGNAIDSGKVGVQNSNPDHKPNLVKNIVEQHYRKKSSSVNTVAVVITNVIKVEKEQYYNEMPDFTDIA